MPAPSEFALPISRRTTNQGGWRCRWPATLAGFLLLLLAVGAAPALADPPPAPDIGLQISASQATAELAVAREALADDPSLTTEDRTRLNAELDRVLDHLTALAQANETAMELREAQASAPGQTATIRARLAAAESLPDPPVELPVGADLAAVQQLLAQETAAVAAQQDRLTTLEQGLTEDAEALPSWRRQREELRQQASDLDDELVGFLATGADGADAQVRRWLLESQRDLLRAEALVLELQVTGAEVRRELAEARRDEARWALEQARGRQAWLEALADERRRDESARLRDETEAARAAVADAHPQVRELARANAELAEAIQAVDQRTAAVSERLAATTLTTTALAQDFANDRQRVAAAGVSQALGRVLIDQRERLPDPRLLRRQAAERAEAEAEARLAQLRWREELLLLRTGAEPLPPTDLLALEPADAAAIEAQLQELQARRLELLERALKAEERHLNRLAELDLVAAELRGLTRAYDDFLAEHLLWLRSHVPLAQQSFAALPTVLAELLRPTHWLEVARTLGARLADAWIWWLGLVLVGLLLGLGQSLRQRIRATAEPLRRIRSDRFAYTLWAIALTLLLAAPVSLLLILAGLMLTGAPGPKGFSQAVGGGLLHIAPGLYCLRAFRQLCMTGGVAERHFRWRANALTRLRRYLNTAIWTLLPLGFLATVVNQLGEIQAATLGRLLLTGVTLGFALLLAGALHPTRGVLRQLLQARPTALLNRSRWLWYPLAVGVPLALAGLTLAGFQYTATTLFKLWINQLWLVLGLVIVQQSIVRWLQVTRRALMLRAVLERHARRVAVGAGDGGAEAPSDAEDEVDLGAMDGHTRSLINALLTLGGGVGLWMLWSDVLPALGVLERVPLWYSSTLVDGVSRSLPVTLADLGLVLIMATAAIVAVRHLPALLEILLLKRTGISAGGRYTIITLTSYSIIAVALLNGAGRLGLNWEQMQWLVAALGVGIGFGLREIAANFIAGLILLFERPVRVGDLVSIGLHDGEVTHIEARATTVRIRDRRELLVPNNQLITQDVINWTLSDQVNRGEIRLSIDYGSDTEAALRILAEIAAADSRVMTDPPPQITAAEFGERGIELLFRFFLPTLANRIEIRGELIVAIDRRLRAAGIAIGLPQRDVRLRNEVLASAGGAEATHAVEPVSGGEGALAGVVLGALCGMATNVLP
ncbi:mechanosensitive ion channel [Lamprobacter modestohalophilus]|uniref:mechanosensitive ion channel domain-containing protein n=1 Tax=Lamprobacter modestohalophilus TaxID=1064514 RepID=UPI002ADEE041|nr:mechanosensitive ion channel domain-containing protein [Lamprobacter modestohalophilus]MEA1049699.1 mechanosensitive ion channel [Lamprobacter modestohalophilus]